MNKKKNVNCIIGTRFVDNETEKVRKKQKKKKIERKQLSK